VRGGQAFRASQRQAFDLPPRWTEGRARAALGAFPYAEHRTLAEVDGLPEPVVFTPERMARSVSTSIDTNGEKKAGPRIKSGVTEYQAKARDEAAGTGPACESPAVERVSRPAAGRSAAATSEPMDVTAGETAQNSDTASRRRGSSRAQTSKRSRSQAGENERVEVGTGQIGAKGEQEAHTPPVITEPSPLPAPRQMVERPAAEPDAPPASPPADRMQHRPRWAAPERVVEVRKAPTINWGRVAEAAKRQNHAPPAPKRPVRVAMDPGPCPRCGVRGTVGCAHQLPYDEAAL
jgi:hypothetical protein